MNNSGHSHGPTAYFVTGCPLCDAAKNARNQAIDHLTEALYLFNGLRPEGEQPTLRLNLGPVNVTGDDVGRCHSFDLTAKQAECLADAIDSLSAYAVSDREGLSLSSEAAVFASQYPAAAALIADTFDEIFAEVDPKVFLNDVLTAPDPDKAGLAYQHLLSGDEDGDA
ncbi:hypothetical protein [Streptomyces sp. NPDC001658]